LALAAILVTSHVVWAGGGACLPIAAPPTTIRESGHYCLTADAHLEDGVAITVAADWVTLDLQGFLLAGPGGNTTAIEATNRLGITIRDGAISGFDRGIRLTGKRGGYHLVQRMRLEEITGDAIWVDGSHVTIRANVIESPNGERAVAAGGIVVTGAISRVLENRISRVAGVALEVAGQGAVVEGNVVSGVGAAGDATGIAVFSGSDVLVLGNELRDLLQGVVFQQAAGVYQGNLLRGVTYPYSGGTNADR